MNKINSETEKRMVEMYKNGISMCKMAKELSVSSGTIYLHLKKFIPKNERQKRKHLASFTEDEARRFADLYLNGMSSVEIGRKFGMGADMVLYALKKSGIDTSKGGKYNPKVTSKKLSEMREKYEKTGSILETANQMGLHPSSVHYRLSKMGVITKKTLNQKTVKMKYDKLTMVLKKLFEKMNFELEYAQERYNGHGPDMIVKNGSARILIEHKATVKNSFYWKHAIEEAKENSNELKIKNCWVITTAKKPKSLQKLNGIKLIFFEDLKNLLISNDLPQLISEIEFISSTPSV